MNLDEFKSVLSNSRLDVWGIIDAAINLASEEYADELKHRRDGIVERLYARNNCSNCDVNEINEQKPNGVVRSVGNEFGEARGDSPLTPQSIPQDNEEDDEDLDPYGGLFDDEQSKILKIKEQLEDPHQSEDSVVELLQTLADMDLTFKGLKETDIGRHVNRLRKHPSNEVRSLVKHLVRKWKELVDEWVGSNNKDHQQSSLTDGDSPSLQNVPRRSHNSNQQGSDFGYSPNTHNWSPSSDRINTEPVQRPKGVVPKRETPTRPITQSHPHVAAASSAPQNRPRKEQNIDPDRLASATRRLQENYQEAQNAKKQRTIQVMDIHEIPKPKNGFIAKNKGNFQGRNHR
ncbi:probable mediator of RNA polymerase II transcription subunit 26c [Rutidosis leptorrhynchoides]|uniref:probable mediator of RNA polymerase II transcription subunit 26c n=1 Tax=Rutidosis leptorrhynchoides TaxID=125765 RepID=UPI003A994145